MFHFLKLFFVCFVSSLSVSRGQEPVESLFLFVAPQALAVEKNETFHLLIFDNPKNDTFKIRLLLPTNGTELGSVTVPYDPDIVQYEVNFPIKDIDTQHATLEVVYGKNKTKSSDVQLYHEKTMMFIETEKPFYKPGELVRFRVLHLKRNLLPTDTPLRKVWIENPSNVKIAQWKNVKINKGFAQLEMQLTKEPEKGTWKIKVQALNTSDAVTKKFQIKEYVLPKFEVTLVPPSYILSKANKSYTWKVCAKYSFGGPVQGNATVSFTFEEPVYWWTKKTNTANEMTELINYELRKEDGCNDFTLSSKIIAKHSDKYLNGIVVNATVEERGTGEKQITSHTSRFHTENMKFSFTNAPKYFYPGLPYYGQIDIKYQDGLEAANVEVSIGIKNGRDFREAETLSAISDQSGTVHFTVVTTNFSDELYIHVKCLKSNVECNSMGNHKVIPWFSPSKSYITINGQSDAICNETLDLEILYTFSEKELGEKLQLFYLVQSKGDIMKRGSTVIAKKNHNFRVRHWQNVFFESHLQNKSSVGKWNLKLRVRERYSPEIKIVIFYRTLGREVVASSKTIKISSCLLNKVESKFSARTAEPGQQVTLSVATSTASLCALSGVDKAVTFLEKNREFDIEAVFERIMIASAKPKEHSAEANYYVEKCELDSESPLGSNSEEESTAFRIKRSMWWQPKKPFGNAHRAFADGGTLMLSNLDSNIKPCESGGFKENCDSCPNDHRYFSIVSRMDSMPIKQRSRARSRPRNDVLRARKITDTSSDFQSKEESNSATKLQDNVELVEMRTDFRESWLWQFEEINNGSAKEIKLQTPHTITDWVLNTVCVSQSQGLGIAAETSIRVTKPYFIDFSLPFSVKRGETLPLKVSIFNYLNHDIPIKLSFGEFTGGDLNGDASFDTCLQRKDKIVHTFELNAKLLGTHNISVISSINFDNSSCGPDVLTEMRDGVTKSIKIKPEGLPVEITKSMFLCLDGGGESALMSWHLDVPENSVPDSARGDVAVIGDLMGPSLENLDHLVRLPTGCGEQNMVLFAPNIVVLKYLEATDSLTHTIKRKANDNLVKGYQRELTYKHDDGSYSAFGKSDNSGSMWLTAFVVKSFAQAKKFIYVDQSELLKSTKWILSHQLENGCFRQIGTVFHKEMKGGVGTSGSIVAFSAYIMIALLESKIEINKGVLENGLFCLKQVQDSDDVYTQALVAYAMQLSKAQLKTERSALAAQISLEKLVHLASTGNNSEIFWQNKGSAHLALSVEMTAYAILTLATAGGEENLMLAFGAVKWISKQRNKQGGFVSTQDTVVALEALAKYAMTVPSKNVEMSLQVATDDGDIMEFNIDAGNRQILQQNDIPYVPTNLHWSATGKGCSLVQSSLRYNLKSSAQLLDEIFTMEKQVKSIVPGSCSELYLAFNLTYNQPEGSSNMAVLEVEMLSGYEPERSTLENLRTKIETFKRWDFEDGVLNLYFDSLHSSLPIEVDFVIIQTVTVANVKAAKVKLFDYYEKESFNEKEYEINELICNANQEEDAITTKPVSDEPISVSGNALEGIEGPVEVFVPAPKNMKP
ncbi:pregnancy zone protein-like isoform X2 [Cloeon dipterum]|uniref:pregnancy zone protein-like isoform X2 n=1 Tax=Cloeon dipterum TaxID=197152 RepID=UPI00321FDF0E